MEVRQFCASCGVAGIQQASLAGPCVFCHQLDGPQPIVMVRNDCRGSISRAIYDRIRLERPVSFLSCWVKNVSLPQLASTLGREPQEFQLAGQRHWRTTIFRDYMCTDWDAIARLCSFHVPASRKGDVQLARARGNLIAFPSGSLGFVAPPLKLTHRIESYGGVQEERLKISFCLCIITPVHALEGLIGFSRDYPLDMTVRKHWPENPGYADPKEYVKGKVIAAFQNGAPIAGLNAVLLNHIGDTAV